MSNNNLVCKEEGCKSKLEFVGRTDYEDGGACGEGNWEEYYRCIVCGTSYELSRCVPFLPDDREEDDDFQQMKLKKINKIPTERLR